MLRKINIKKTNDPRYSNKWQVRWRETDGSQPKRSFPTRAAAEMFRRHLEAEFVANQCGQTVTRTFGEITEEFLQAKRGERLAAETLKIYRQVFSEFAAVIGQMPSTQISLRQIDVFRGRLTGSPATINKKLRHLSALFSWGLKRNYFRSNPVPLAGKLREPKKAKTCISPQEWKQLEAAIDDPQWLVLAHLGLHGAARKHSIAAMARRDVDLAAGTVTVLDRKTQQTRTTPLHAVSLKILTDYIAKLPKGQEALFTSEFHHSTWTRYCKLAGVSTTFHGLRTCMSTWLKRAGVSGEVVTAILGHSSTQVTYDHYTALDDVAAKREALDKLPL